DPRPPERQLAGAAREEGLRLVDLLRGGRDRRRLGVEIADRLAEKSDPRPLARRGPGGVRHDAGGEVLAEDDRGVRPLGDGVLEGREEAPRALTVVAREGDRARMG